MRIFRNCIDSRGHASIIANISQRVNAGSILQLIGMFFKGGVLIDHQVEPKEQASPQGGVISVDRVELTRRVRAGYKASRSLHHAVCL